METALKSLYIDKLREITPRLTTHPVSLSSSLQTILDILSMTELSNENKVEICSRQIKSLLSELGE